MNYQTKQDQLEALRRPFPIEAVKEREQGGKTLYYYAVEVVRARLNEVFAADYEFRVNQVITTETTMDMSCILTLRWLDGSSTVVEDWGSSDILRSKDGSFRVNDPAKTCASDALKRCLAFVGCGAELWSESYRAEIEVKKKQAEEASRQKAFLTCQECGGTIDGGTVSGKDLSAQEVAVATRSKFKKRLCLGCARDAQQAGKVAA